MHRDRLDERGGSKVAARRHVGELLGIAPTLLWNWIERDEAAAPGAVSPEPDTVASSNIRFLRMHSATVNKRLSRVSRGSTETGRDGA
ncbi:hypothetical protein [Rhodococcus koreensis]|uniref:hypothetical protein n=1 Tax=Rhodococcus koreensis TaxID=99653 RepID=UPI0009341B24|nr:hypothetical protein [Rhodococcus koreensis]